VCGGSYVRRRVIVQRGRHDYDGTNTLRTFCVLCLCVVGSHLRWMGGRGPSDNEWDITSVKIKREKLIE
jgi:hypothetical protein